MSTFHVNLRSHRRRDLLCFSLAGALILISPFVAFIRHSGYQLVSAEALLVCVLLAVLGFLAGLAMAFSGRVLQALAAALLLTLYIDLQTGWFSSPVVWDGFQLRWALAWSVGTLSIVLFLFGRKLAPVLSVASAGMLMGALAIPSAPVYEHERLFVGGATPVNSNLPLFLHIILDGQIGIEGIHESSYSDGLSEELRGFYRKWGFSLFGRAYSRYSDTRESLSNLLNFDVSDGNAYYIDNGGRLLANGYFKLMRSRGYHIRVYQTDYLDFCHSDQDSVSHSCTTYGYSPLVLMRDTQLGLGQRIRVLVGLSYLRRSYLLKRIGFWNYIRLPQRIALSPMSATRMLEAVKAEVHEATPGSLFVVHLMLPHAPYAFDENCRVKADPIDWPDPWESSSKSAFSAVDQYYPAYLHQVSCIHKRLGTLFQALSGHDQFEQAAILVHGDHGARFSMRKLLVDESPEWSEDDLVDMFSTLFAFKPPGGSPSYDRRLLPIDVLFENVVQKGGIPTGSIDESGGRVVYVGSWTGESHPAEMPEFGSDHDGKD